MTKLMDQAVEAVRQLPPTSQDSLARAILSVAQGGRRDEIDPEHLPYVLEGLTQLARGEVASDDEIAEAIRTFGACRSNIRFGRATILLRSAVISAPGIRRHRLRRYERGRPSSMDDATGRFMCETPEG